MKNLRVLGVVLLVATLPACVWAPGQRMDTRELQRHDSADHSHYQLVPITPKEIAIEQAEQATVAMPQALLDYKPRPYRIGSGDSLNITVWEHPELTSPAGSQQAPGANGRLVRSDGMLFYPYVGLLHAAGMTLEELRSAITRSLAKVIEKPQVDVSVITYGSQRVTLRGAFTKTDPEPITVVPLTLSQAIGAAGIDTAQANISDLILTRDGHEYHVDLDALSRSKHGLDSVWLKPGDELYLPYNDRQEAYVMGEVIRPMAIPFKTTDVSLTQVLGRAGGLMQTTAKGKSVYVIRGVKDMEKTPATIYQLDAKSPAAFALASNFAVHPGDVVFVGAAGITRWNRFLSQLLPSSNIINSAAVSHRDFSN